MKWKALIGCIGFVGSVVLFWSPSSRAQGYSWSAVEQLINRRFPKTPTITKNTLVEWMNDSQPLVLIDVRSVEEFQVGHIWQAQNWMTAEEIISNTDPDTRMVLYCSVGYRSAGMVQQLKKKGYTNLFNLEGSIFEWANQGHSIYRGTRAVKTVHPYNTIWGNLLHKDYHAYQ